MARGPIRGGGIGVEDRMNMRPPGSQRPVSGWIRSPPDPLLTPETPVGMMLFLFRMPLVIQEGDCAMAFAGPWFC